MFEDISTFHAKNPTGGFLFCEINMGRKVLPCDLIKNPSGPPGKNFEIEKNRLNKLRGKDEPIDNKNNNNFSPPPLPPICTSTWLSFQPTPSVFGSFSTPHLTPRRPDNNCGNFHIPAQLSSENFANKGLSGNIFGLQTATLTKEKEKVIQDSVQRELDDTIYELPDPPKLELRDSLLNMLGVETDDILDRKFINQKE